MAAKQRTVEIGEIPIRLRSTHDPFWSCVERSFGGFFASDATVPVETIEVCVPPERELPLPDGSPPGTERTEEDGLVRLVHGYGVAEWDRRKNYARVRQPGRDYERVPRPEYVCSSVLRMMLADRLLARDGCLVHAASLARDGRGYLFAGPSGAGKSTLARLCAGSCTVLSDDVSLVRLTPNGARVFATPFLGEFEAVTANTSAPLAAVFLLRQAPRHAVVPVARRLAVRELVREVSFAALDARSFQATLDLVVRLVDRIPSFELHFRPDASFWELIDDTDDAADSDSE